MGRFRASLFAMLKQRDLYFATVAEAVDAGDSKSLSSDGVKVRFLPVAFARTRLKFAQYNALRLRNGAVGMVSAVFFDHFADVGKMAWPRINSGAFFYPALRV